MMHNLIYVFTYAEQSFVIVQSASLLLTENRTFRCRTRKAMFHRLATTDIQFSCWENEFNLPSTRSWCRVKNGMNECRRLRLLKRKKLNETWRCWFTCPGKKKREKNSIPQKCIYCVIKGINIFFKIEFSSSRINWKRYKIFLFEII